MSSTGSSNAARRAVPRFAEAAVERARLSVVPRLRSRAPRVPFVTLVSVLLLAGVVGLLLFNTSMQQASFTATSLEDQADDLTARQQALAVELEQLRDPQNLAVRARRLGLVPPPAPSFVDLDSGTFSGPMIPATAEDDLGILPPAPKGLEQPPPVSVTPDVPSDPVNLGNDDNDNGNGDGGRTAAERKAEQKAEQKAQAKAEQRARRDAREARR